MEQNREQRRAGSRSRRRRHQAVAGGVALATTVAVGGWGAPAGAGTAAPSAHAECVVNNGEPTLGTNRVSGRLAGFQASQPFQSVIIMKGPRNGRTFNFVIDFGTPTEADGTYTTPGGAANGVPFTGVPVQVGWIVYRDLNNNGRYDHQTDETVYQGNGEVTACPQTITLTPK